MRRSGRIVRRALDAAACACVPGSTTAEVDEAAVAVIEAAGAVGLFRNYPSYLEGEGFPGNVCVSVNDEVVHGIPGDRVLAGGDIVTIDCGVRCDGWCADAAVTVAVGTVRDDVRRLLEATAGVLALAVEMIRPGIRWSAVARAMQARAEAGGFGVVQDYVGHGIGRALHEQPQAPGFLSSDFERWHDFTLAEGMTLAVEPMLTLGSAATRTLGDGWTVVTADGMPSCHMEHTIAVLAGGSDVLTDGR